MIGEAALAMDTNSFSNDKNPLLESVRILVKSVIVNRILGVLPELNWLSIPIITKFKPVVNPELQKHAIKLHIWLKKVIKDRKSSDDSSKNDMLQLMLDTQTGVKKRTLSDDEITAQAFLYVLAGYETTSTALSYTTFLLATHQDVQEKLYTEIQKHCQDLVSLTKHRSLQGGLITQSYFLLQFKYFLSSELSIKKRSKQ